MTETKRNALQIFHVNVNCSDFDRSLAFYKTIGFKDNVVAVTQRAAAAIGGIPSWFGAIGDRIGGEDPSPRPPGHLISEL